MDKISKFETKVLVAFAAAVLVVAGLTLAARKESSDSAKVALQVSRAEEVLYDLAKVRGDTLQIELSTQSYRISGDTTQVTERDTAISEREASLRQINVLISDDAPQQERWTQLRQAVDQRIAIARRSVLLRKTEGLRAASAYIATAPLRETRERVFQLLHEMEVHERRLLDDRRAERLRVRNVEFAIDWIAALALVALLTATYFFIRRQLRTTEASRRALEAANARIAAILDTAAEGIITINERGIVETINPAAMRMFGYAAAEVVGRNIKMLMPEPYHSQHDGYLEHYIATGEAHIIGRELEVVGQRKNGETFPMELAVSEMKLVRERRFTGIVRDITARKQSERTIIVAREEADTANRAKSTFLATMSHEIRTPMNGVLGMLELLSLSKLDAEQRSTLEIVRASGKSLLRIIDDILDFSKIEAGKLELRPEVGSIKEIIEGVTNLYTGTASSKALLLKHSTDPQISTAVLVDPVRLRQILNNFVSNALKFTSHGYVEIKAELVERKEGEDRVRFSVTDTGIGISAEDQGRLFQPFSQAGGNSGRRAGGTGLGLTICRRLAGMMGGLIEMVSAPGKGTTMILTLSLPIADPKDLVRVDAEEARDSLSAASRISRAAPGVAQAEAEGTLVLLADDHPTNRALLARQVHTLGYAAESAENGMEALDKWKSGRFGIVITDCNMPEMDGYELARAIRRLESASGGKRTPIIACTANALGGDAEICFAAGMDDYLAKPVELTALLTKLDQWLPITEPGAASPNIPAIPSNSAEPNSIVPLDRTVLAAISRGDAAVEHDILLDFRRVNDDDAAMLKEAVAKSDLPQVTRASHRIKGASRIVGAMALAAVCERIEHASRADEWQRIQASMGAFHEEWMRLNAYLDALSPQMQGREK